MSLWAKAWLNILLVKRILSFTDHSFEYRKTFKKETA